MLAKEYRDNRLEDAKLAVLFPSSERGPLWNEGVEHIFHYPSHLTHHDHHLSISGDRSREATVKVIPDIAEAMQQIRTYDEMMIIGSDE